MTNEEAIKMLISKMDGNTDTSYEWAETIRMAIKALEQQSSDCISMGVYKQMAWERDVAIEQLKELGYGFGEKIRTSDNCVSRQVVKEGMIKYGFHAPDMTVTEFIEDELSPVTPTQSWIPVSERYPSPEDENRQFLVTDINGEVSVQKFYLTIDEPEKQQPYFSGMRNIVAWQPLPKPYEEKRGDSDGSD